MVPLFHAVGLINDNEALSWARIFQFLVRQGSFYGPLSAEVVGMGGKGPVHEFGSSKGVVRMDPSASE